MELSDAIERVGRILALPQGDRNSFTGEFLEALALVLEAAKRPGVSIEYRGRAKPKPFYGDEEPTLAGPGFTGDDLYWLKEFYQRARQAGEPAHPALAAKLDAYLEGLNNGGTD